jgi:excisionase family DNA binding protein
VYVYDKITIFTGSEIVSEIMNEKWSSLEEIANHLGVSKDTIYLWISNKKMPGHKIGRLWKFKVSEVDAWVRNGCKDK